MYKVLWNHLDQNLKKAPAPAVFLALLTSGLQILLERYAYSEISGTSILI